MPTWKDAAQGGREARRRGNPRQAPNYDGVPLKNAWLAAYDREDERLAFEHSRPRFAGQDLWQVAKRG